MCYLYVVAITANWKVKEIGDYADAGGTPYYPELPVAGQQNFPAGKLLGSASHTGGGFSDVPGSMNTLKSGGFKGLMMYNISGISSEAAFLTPYVSALKRKDLSVLPNYMQ